MSAPMVTAVVWERTGPVILSRVRGQGGAYVNQASITSIDAHVYDMADGMAEVLPAPSYDKLTSVFDTLQTDPRWPLDAVGYNCAFAVPAANIPRGATTPSRQPYLVVILMTPADGSPGIPIVARLDSQFLPIYDR